MSITFVGNKYDPLTTHSQQLLRLGTVARDEFGRQWSYVQINETLAAGDVVRDSTNYDARAATRNTSADHEDPNAVLIVATPVAAGDTTLEISTVTPTALWLGGVGAVVSDNTASNVTAVGQQFIVTGINSASNIQVEWLTNRVAPLTSTRGVVFAGSGTLEFSLIIPGQVYRGPKEDERLATDPGDGGNSSFVRGIIQNDVTVTAGSEPYGWVLQKGIGWAKYLGEEEDESGPAPLNIAGAVAFLGAEGSVRGIFKRDALTTGSPPIDFTNDTLTGNSIRAALRYAVNEQQIGRLMNASPAAHASQSTNLVPLYVSVDNESTNMLPVRATHPLNSVDIV